MKNSQTKNRKAARLCRFIEELQVVFSNHLFAFEKYTSADDVRICTVKRFFKLNDTYDLVVLCWFIQLKLSEKGFVNFRTIVKRFRLTLENSVQMNDVLNCLRKRHILEISTRNNDNQYALSNDCMARILNYDWRFFSGKNGSFIDFLKKINALLRFSDDECYLDEKNAISELIDEYAHTTEIKWLRKQNLPKTDEALLCVSAMEYLLYHGSVKLDYAASVVTSGPFEKYEMKSMFMSGQNRLLSEGFLCLENNHSAMDVALKITDKTILGLCPNENVNDRKSFSPKIFTLTEPENIPDESYRHDNPGLQLIENMVKKENYDRISKKVPRLTVLLTGAPGVGKTAFLHHLARTTGRPLLSANIAQILSCWVGESEQRLVKLFAEAQQAYEQCSVTPVIMLDEAETLLYKRSMRGTSGVSRMNNNLISLLLMSLDKFKGILICCSNFGFNNGNYDSALHRRFHKIIDLKAPTLNVLTSIFQHYFPEYTIEETMAFLAAHQHITPAQIRSLREKSDVEMMISETGNIHNVVTVLMETELLYNACEQRRPIGFSFQNK